MVLGIEPPRLGKVLAKGCVNTGVFTEFYSFLKEQRLGDIKHRIIGTPSGKVELLAFQQEFGRFDSLLGFLQELLRFPLHKEMHSFRTL